jgi:hypothetical protein
MGTSCGFSDVNAGLKSFSKMGDMGDCQNAGKVAGDRINGGNQAIRNQPDLEFQILRQ